MKFPSFIDGTNEVRSTQADCQRTINLYPEIVGEGGKNTVTLNGTPGLLSVVEVGSGPIRGIQGDLALWDDDEEYFLVASGSELYRVTADYATVTKIDDIADDATHTPVHIAFGLGGYLIVSSGVPYSLIPSTATFAEITTLSAEITAVGAEILNNYYITTDGMQKFYISTPGDPTAWDLLDFGTAESSADEIVAIKAFNDQLWIFGRKSSEIFYMPVGAEFPFERLPNGSTPFGVMAPESVQAFNNTIVWIGQDANGTDIVWQAAGLIPQRISTHAVETMISGANADVGGLSWQYQILGHQFYVISFPAVAITLVYDAMTGKWHEWLYWDTSGETDVYAAHLGSCHTIVGRDRILGSRLDGNLYHLKDVYHDDNGDVIRRLRRAPHLQSENKKIRYNSFELAMETNTGTIATDPQIYLRYSNDGGRNYLAPLAADIGETGDNPKMRVKWRRLGSARDRVFEVYSTASIRHCWIDAYLELNLEKN